MAILFKNIDLLNENFSVEHNCYVIVEDKKIVKITDTAPFEENCYERTVDGKNKLLLPGFYNIHTHLAMSLLRGYAEDMKLQQWLFDKIFPFEAKLTHDDIYWGATLCIAECLRFGIVSVTDMYMDASANAEAVLDTGIKANLALMAANGLSSDPYPFAGAEEWLREYHNAADGKLRLDAYIHAEYTTRESFVRQVAAFAKEKKLNIHMHLSETRQEHEECKERRGGRTPAQYFNDCGVFESPATAAHCVWVEADDMAIFKEKAVTVASNPVSNLKLASGICPVKEMLDLGINIGIGTDGVSSNNNLNMLEEMKTLSLLQKIKTDNPVAVSVKDVVYSATAAGAKSQGRLDSGVIKEGNKADLIMLDLDRPYMYPRHNLLNNLLFSAMGTDVVLTMVDGEILYEDGEYAKIDLERVIFETEVRKKRILGEL
ncbi:MAG: amidohydrolase [Bacillota bacterium]|jgi:5-methylthioadenosine/S-adenosylhomocysteine deaminase